MRSLDTAPKGVNVLVKTAVRGRVNGSPDVKIRGFKIVEARIVDGIWEEFTGDEASKYIGAPIDPVGWWPLPGDESMIVDLKDIPDEWWLYGLFHNHTPILYLGDEHRPFDESDDTDGTAFTVKLQHRGGGKLTVGQGPSPSSALSDAIREVELRWMDVGEDR